MTNKEENARQAACCGCSVHRSRPCKRLWKSCRTLGRARCTAAPGARKHWWRCKAAPRSSCTGRYSCCGQALPRRCTGKESRPLPPPQCRHWNSTASCWCAAMPPPGRCWRPGWKTFPARKKVFDFGAMSYANAALTARLSRKLRKAPQAEPARTLARVQAMQRLTGAALAVGCVELPQSRLLLVGGKKGCWLRCVSPDENPGLWLLDMLRRAACGLPQAGGTNWQPYGRAVPDAALTPAALTAEPLVLPRPKRRRLGKALVVLFAAGTGSTGCGLVLYRRRPCRPAPKAAKPWRRKPAPRRGKAGVNVAAWRFHQRKNQARRVRKPSGLDFALASPM